MKYIDIKNSSNLFHIVSENKIIEANIDKIHPELTLEDNSMIILDSVKMYYILLSDTNIFPNGGIDKEINLENLIECSVDSDTVVDTVYDGSDVNMIFKIEYCDSTIYYIQRIGFDE